MIDSSSFISALAKSWGVSNLAKSDGVVLFTLSSVHWADKHTATSISKGVEKSRLHFASG